MKKSGSKKDVKKIKFKSHKDMPPCAISLADTRYNKTGTWRSLRPVVDKDKCISCLLCWKFCPDVAIKMDEDEFPQFDLDHCKGCGICAKECPKDAITMVMEGD